MNITLTDEQQAIAESARAFLDEHGSSARLRAAIESADGWDPEQWRAMAQEMGWLGVAAPERFGGSDLGLVELAILHEEVGRTLTAAPLFPTLGLALPALMSAGCEARQAEFLPRLIEGGIRAAVCLTGATGAPVPSDVAIRLEPDSDGWRLNGTAEYVLMGHAANLLIVIARTAGTTGWDGLSLLAVAADTPGISIERLTSLDLTRPFSRVHFHQARVGDDSLLGAPGTAAAAVRRMLAVGTVMLAAEQLGGAERALEISTEYAKQRVQFGRVIGSFQAIKHKLADMMLAVESARSALYYAVRLLDVPDAMAEAAATAGACCSEAFLQCAGDTIQIHGGIGFTWEHDAHLYFKRARASAALLGGPSHHYESVASLIGLDEAPETSA
ncbi:MAG: acyl-CoA/acyl-ACP dehydrogenase [Brevundimonas sp.]|uniref:acyl-CoA dehydrogenase family protein n=1 Tax=Brevundimonas sp. TaxID=1871086 RepID=UPI002489047D|nr:acyl-CoA dehydrogenase family protein [Brevundimonas sp.]MDI1328509.1 acyl-CoA/acyl-ACP dehydrogenase [Brevundimonas sp.]